MAVAILATDTWITHLPFTGQRPSPFGPVDGIWYGLLAGDGAAGGGNFSLNGSLSFDRKEDWVYILGALETTTNQSIGGTDVLTQVNTGPLIPTGAVATSVTNPSFMATGDAGAGGAATVTSAHRLNGGADYRAGLPIFGDKRIPGTFLMLAAAWGLNTDGATYQLSAWGFLIRYQSFFRDRPAALG